MAEEGEGRSRKEEREELSRRVARLERELREAHRVREELKLLKRSLESISIGITVAAVDGRIVYTNPHEAAMHGYEVGELIGKDVSIFAPGKRKKLSEMDLKAISEWTREVYNIRKDGTAFPVQLTSVVVTDDGGDPSFVITISEDITERKRMEEEILQAKHDWENTFDSITDYITIHDKCFNVVRANRAAAEAFKGQLFTDGRFKGFPGFHEDGLSRGEYPGCRTLETGRSETLEVFDKHVGRRFEVSTIPRRDAAGAISGIIQVARDITDRWQMEEDLRVSAIYDKLTGLPNRTLLMEHLKGLFDKRHREADHRFALLFIDLDNFKKINDSLGHQTGDKLLVSVGKRLNTCVRPGDTVSRFGGDEFVIILDDLREREEVAAVARRVQEAFGAPFPVDGTEIFSTASTGIAFIEEGYEKIEDFVRDADTAMYNAKKMGKACYSVFTKDMHARALGSLNMEIGLRRALENKEFVLHYQPIVGRESDRMEGVEALVRWQHPEKGLLLPAAFLPVAEETGLITPLGAWVLEEACRQMRDWHDRYPRTAPGYVSVNLSVKQFAPDLAADVAERLAAHGLHTRSLRLEITESLVMSNLELALGILSGLNYLNIEVYLDDFGTGYSSLSYLNNIPFDGIKLDHSFVKGISHDERVREVANAVVQLTRRLGRGLVVEGIESAEQFNYFRDVDNASLQGFLFSQPLDAKRLEEYLDEDNPRALSPLI